MRRYLWLVAVGCLSLAASAGAADIVMSVTVDTTQIRATAGYLGRFLSSCITGTRSRSSTSPPTPRGGRRSWGPTGRRRAGSTLGAHHEGRAARIHDRLSSRPLPAGTWPCRQGIQRGRRGPVQDGTESRLHVGGQDAVIRPAAGAGGGVPQRRRAHRAGRRAVKTFVRVIALAALALVLAACSTLMNGLSPGNIMGTVSGRPRATRSTTANLNELQKAGEAVSTASAGHHPRAGVLHRPGGGRHRAHDVQALGHPGRRTNTSTRSGVRSRSPL